MQKHSWEDLMHQKKKNQTPFLLTELMLINLKDAVPTKAAKRHEEHIADRRHNSVSVYKLPILIPKAMTILEGEAAVDK